MQAFVSSRYLTAQTRPATRAPAAAHARKSWSCCDSHADRNDVGGRLELPESRGSGFGATAAHFWHEAQRRCARTSHRVAQTRRTGCHGLRSRRRSELNGRAKRTDCGFSSGATTAARILRVGGTMSDLRRRLERKKKPKAETISAVHTVPLPATRAFRPALAVEAQDAWNNRQDAASVHPPSGFAPVTRPVGR